MQNVYDIRKNEQLLFLLPLDRINQAPDDSGLKTCAVFVNLYYPDTVLKYMKYLNLIPDAIEIYIYSSSKSVLEKAKNLQKRSHIRYQIKENRGRDISTLLVAAADYMLQYEYVCFLHDKKANAKHLEKDTDIWIENLWGNTIGSESYIYNILNLFEQNRELGLLVPPEAFGTYIAHWYGDTWLEDYPLCRKLGSELQLNADIAKSREVFTIGTVFWAKTRALKKLLKRGWDYTDFPKEPLPIDGTISHAIEKIFGYAAQDAGYKTGTVMSEKYASWLLLSAQEYMRSMFRQLAKREHVYNMAQIMTLDEREKQIHDFCSRYNNIFIYGAGNYGKSMLGFLKDRGWDISGFLVSPGQRKTSFVEMEKVWEVQELNFEAGKDMGVIIGVSYEFRADIEAVLKEYGCQNFLYGY